MTLYYKITGLDEGIPIEPYCIVCTEYKDTLKMNLQCYGDMARYYEPISEEEYEEYVKELVDSYKNCEEVI